jgi:hypothetical protein
MTDNRKPTGTHMNKATMTTSIGSNMVLPSTFVDVRIDYIAGTETPHLMLRPDDDPRAVDLHALPLPAWAAIQ